MANNTQPFEKLIRLEDEELDSDGAPQDNNLSDSESCKVPMMAQSQTESLDKNRPTRAMGGIHFTINGRHIQMNSDQLKYLSLITLTVQNAALNLTMRGANTQLVPFSKPVAVTVAEILKLVTCFFLVCYDEYNIRNAMKTIKKSIVVNYVDTLKVAVPSFVYYIQNNLLYIGSTHLDAATNQVTYQLKILTTAVFSVTMLNKKLNKIQWAALIILFIGVAMIEALTVSVKPLDDHELSKHNQTLGLSERKTIERPWIGIVALLIASCLSGFAGVYFEKILKNSSHVSLWIRNIQLAVVAIPIGLLQVFVFEHEAHSEAGIFKGFTALTWLCIMLQAQGGLLVAVVVKFANNILKGFATSLAIVISTIASMFLFGFELTPQFILGASLVIGSVMMYSRQ